MKKPKNIQMPEVVVHRCSVRRVFLEISKNSQENTCARISFFNKVAGLRPVTLLKKTQVFSCEFCEISKNTFFHRTHMVAASEVHKTMFMIKARKHKFTDYLFPFNWFRSFTNFEDSKE